MFYTLKAKTMFNNKLNDAKMINYENINFVPVIRKPGFKRIVKKIIKNKSIEMCRSFLLGSPRW